MKLADSVQSQLERTALHEDEENKWEPLLNTLKLKISSCYCLYYCFDEFHIYLNQSMTDLRHYLARFAIVFQEFSC